MLLSNSVVRGRINAQWFIVPLRVNLYVNFFFSITPQCLMFTRNKKFIASYSKDAFLDEKQPIKLSFKTNQV